MKPDIRTFGKFRYFFLVNGMLLGNMSANFIGDFMEKQRVRRLIDFSIRTYSARNRSARCFASFCVGAKPRVPV